MLTLTKEPEVWQNIEDKSLIEKYEVNGENILFNLDNSPISFNYFIIEIRSNEDKEVEDIFISFENQPSNKIREMTKFILLDENTLNLLKEETVSVVFSIKKEAIENYINPKYKFMEEQKLTLFDLKDENNSIVLLNFKYYDLITMIN